MQREADDEVADREGVGVRRVAPNAVAAAASAAEGRYAPVNGLNMYYEISGAGEPLIYIPAAFAFAGITEFPELARHWRVVQVLERAK